MAAQSLPTNPSESTAAEPKGELCPVARQPILNLSGRLYGYELLIRNGPDAVRCRDGQEAISTLLDDTVLFGLERLTNGFPAFVVCTEEMLSSSLTQILPPAMTILAIPESVEFTPELIESCRKLKARGFKLALDDFTGRLHPLEGLVDYIRVDFSAPGMNARTELRRWFTSGIAAMMAKRVETHDDYCRAAAEGFTLFQGDFLFRPAMVKNSKMPANRLLHFEILQNLYREPVDLRRLSHLVMREASLAYRLLRLVNSPVCAIRQEVRSVEAALIVVGIDTFRRFATLAILSEATANENPELLQIALVRARFCEVASRMSRLNSAEQYLLGLFSLLPAMLRMPMEEITPSLPLRDEIRQALEGTESRERCLLEWLVRHEHGEWQACDVIEAANSLKRDRLIRCYSDALVWARAALHSSSSGS